MESDEIRQLRKLIHFHEEGLAQYCQFMNPSAQYLEKLTIKILKQALENKLGHQ